MRKSARKKNNTKFKKSSRSKQGYKTGIIVLGFLLGLIFLGKLLSFIDGLSYPFTPDAPVNTAAKSFFWDGKKPVNVLVKADSLYLWSFNPDTNRMVLVKIPDQTQFSLPFDYGFWPVRSIYGLGQTENPSNGALLLTRTIESAFAVAIDGYVFTSPVLNFQSEIKQIRQNPLNSLSLFRQSKTDLTPLELWKLSWGIKNVRSDKVELVDLDRTEITSWVLLPDGSRVLKVDQAKLDILLAKSQEDRRLTEERLTVGIFNATVHPQLAEKAARMVANLGGRVIFIGNTEVKLAETIVTGQISYTKDRLSEIFAGFCTRQNSGSKSWPEKIKNIFHQGTDKPGCKGENEVDRSRADVNIFLGEDYFLRYNREVSP
ncbi:MAG: hypothetical protein C4584_02745 [Armatimonadetes bacterium]|nr:MAG: hypothetical protein C4584_02745 [Armatimonadota bacterium]